MIKLLVIADDLTGANDTGVQFTKQGIATFVTVDLDVDINALPPDLQVLVVDTESRHLPPDEAACRVIKIAGSAREHGVAYFYKKTDSTLRGNVGAELDAALAASGSKVLAFIPAFPKAGRYTRNGFQYIGDKLLHLTQFGSDPLEPIKSSFVPEILGLQTRRKVTSVSLTDTGGCGEGPFGDDEIILFDCQNNTDLREIGACLGARNMLNMTAGSAGFAEVLPELLQLPRTVQDFAHPEGPLLIINGSLNEESLRQVAYAEERGVKTFVLPQEMLSGSPHKTTGQIRNLCSNLAREAAAGNNVIVRSAANREQLDALLLKNNINRDIKDVYHGASERLGRIVLEILRKASFSSIAVFGGDTLIGILKAMGITGIRPLNEIFPGIVVSRMADVTQPLSVVSKAGGFGDEDVIMRIISYLRGKNR